MPFALVGLISCLALWDVFKFCADKWGLDHHPVVRQCLVRIAQCVTAVILIYSNVQMAMFCALGISMQACFFMLHSGSWLLQSNHLVGEVSNRFGQNKHNHA